MLAIRSIGKRTGVAVVVTVQVKAIKTTASTLAQKMTPSSSPLAR